MKVVLQPALVLHRRAYRESSLLLELFTAEYGRVGAVSRSAKRRGPILQPLQLLLVSWGGRGELASLHGVELAPNRIPPLQGMAMTCGLYLNELLFRMLARNDPQPALFSRYCECLLKLGEGHDPDWLLRRFELSMLTELGYGGEFSRDADSGAPVESERHYHYQPDHGPVLTAGDRTAGMQSAWHVDGQTLLALRHDQPPADSHTRRKAKRLMQALIDYHCGGVALKTRELLKPIWKQHD